MGIAMFWIDVGGRCGRARGGYVVAALGGALRRRGRLRFWHEFGGSELARSGSLCGVMSDFVDCRC